jgi:hypothetical protein
MVAADKSGIKELLKEYSEKKGWSLGIF